MFRDRKDAGQQLGAALKERGYQGGLALGIPRGGVEVAYFAANAIEADLSVVIARKLPFPNNPESGFGAVAEDGSVYLVDRYQDLIPDSVHARAMDEQRKEAQRRVKTLRGGRPLPELENRTVYLIDDGIAMGSTMRACIQLCRNRNAGGIVVAAPVSSPRTKERLTQEVDDVVILETPHGFRAVAQVYETWYDVGDVEARGYLEVWREEHAGAG